MSRRAFVVFAVLSIAFLLPLAAAAQQPEPSVFTFVAEWNVARAQWDEATANFDKNVRPAMDRLMAAGTITGWGSFTSSVHSTDGVTHGTWFTASSAAGILKAFDELVKQPTSPTLTSAKHWDFFLRSMTWKSRGATPPASGYLWVNTLQVQPGKGQEWRDLWDKYNKPVYDELLASGTITQYAIQAEYVHTQDPALRHIVYVAPNADAIDKVLAALQAANQKRSPEERQAITEAFARVVVAGAHRDYVARVLSYAQK